MCTPARLFGLQWTRSVHCTTLQIHSTSVWVGWKTSHISAEAKISDIVIGCDSTDVPSLLETPIPGTRLYIGIWIHFEFVFSLISGVRISEVLLHIAALRLRRIRAPIVNPEPFMYFLVTKQVCFSFLSPPVHFARWTHMHHFASVCPSGLDQKSDWKKLGWLKMRLFLKS